MRREQAQDSGGYHGGLVGGIGKLMERLMFGVLAANFAAPCLLILLIFLKGILAGTRISLEDFVSGLPAAGFFVVVSWCVMAATIFPVSLLLAVIGRKARWRSAWIFAAAGAAISLLFSLGIFPLLFNEIKNEPMFYVEYGLIGTVCGWIYWRIALSPRAREPAGAP
jgi:hypothetical protein